MQKMKLETPDLVAGNLEKIAALFPNCITEMLDTEKSTPEHKVYKKAVNFELLKQMLSDEVLEGEEAYEFTWVGKKASIVEANRPIRKTLRPCPEESKNWDVTENLYIEGDNLDVLKLLQESYLNKVKIIYIDPPYNTGSDFVYKDNFSQDTEQYDRQLGMFDVDNNKLFKNTEANGKFHSDWCSMMFSRLALARNLLNESGVIFISIDDNEQDNLKKICDEVFGASNFIGEYIKQSKVGGGSDSKFIVKEHEYCYVYAKNINVTPEMYMAHTAEYLKRYCEEDSEGKFFWDTFARPGLKNPIHYDIVAPDGSRCERCSGMPALPTALQKST